MKLEGQNIIILSLFRFDAELESTSYAIAKQLSQNNRVFYFDNPYTLNDFIKRRNSPEFHKRRGFFNLFSSASLKIEEAPNLEIVFSPILLSINFLPEGILYRTLLRFNQFLISLKLRQVLKKRKIKDYVFINSFNFHYPEIAKHLQPKISIYHCLDPIQGDFDGRHGIKSEQILLKNSDLVICSSKNLYSLKKEYNPNTHFVPNAADISISSKALDPNLPILGSFSKLGKPIIGYLGSIDHRTDFKLLEEVARKNRNKNFVFLGPVFGEISKEIEVAKNIYFLGKIPYKDMPSALKGFDVCIIPFKQENQNESVFPLKLFEYLGAGKPVVATNFNPDLKDFTENTVRYCLNADEFSEAINLALEEDSKTFQHERMVLAAQNTWESRANAISDLFEKYMEKKAKQ